MKRSINYQSNSSLTHLGILLLLVAFVTTNTGCATMPVTQAINQGKQDRALKLINSGKGIEEVNQNGETPLHIAAKKSDVKIGKALLEQGANPNAKSKVGAAPMHSATLAQKISCEFLNLLIEYKADVNVKNQAGATPLIFAASRNRDVTQVSEHIAMVKILIDSGAEIDAVNQSDMTALHYAAYNGEPFKIVEMLITAGANPNHPNKTGITPLIQAAANNHQEAFNILADAGGTPSITCRDDLENRTEENNLVVNLTFENNARTYAMYADYLAEKGQLVESNTFYNTAASQFELAEKEFERAATVYKEAIPGAKAENAGRIVGSILGTVFGVALAATTGTGFFMTPNTTNKAEVYAELCEKYSNKAVECHEKKEIALSCIKGHSF